MADLFRLKIITPEKVFFDGEVEFVEMSTTEGEIGVYRNHVPMTMLLSPGVLSIHAQTGTRLAALHTGFVEILPEQVSVVAEIAEWPEEIDFNRAKEEKIRAERRLEAKSSDDNLMMAEISLKKALTRLEVVKKS